MTQPEEETVGKIRKTIEDFKLKIDERGGSQIAISHIEGCLPEIQALVDLMTMSYLNPSVTNWKSYPSAQGFWKEYSLSNNAPTKIIRIGDIMNSIIGFNPYHHSVTLQISAKDVSGDDSNNILLETYVLSSGVFTKEFAYPLSASPYTNICLSCSHNLVVSVRKEHLSQEHRKTFMQTSYIICTSSYNVYIVSGGQIGTLEQYLQSSDLNRN